MPFSGQLRECDLVGAGAFSFLIGPHSDSNLRMHSTMCVSLETLDLSFAQHELEPRKNSGESVAFLKLNFLARVFRH